MSPLDTAGPRHSTKPAVSQARLTTRNWAVSLTTEKDTVFLFWTCSQTDCRLTPRNCPKSPSVIWAVICLVWQSDVTIRVSVTNRTGRWSLFIVITNAGTLLDGPSCILPCQGWISPCDGAMLILCASCPGIQPSNQPDVLRLT